ncbi:MAG: HlyD family efflux transporter periplasmic adaptor subunit [Planctomycetota bacterium]
MTVDQAYQRSSIDRPLVLRARADIQRASVQFASQTNYVLKDPLTLEMFHLSAEEFFLFDSLKASMSIKQLQRAFESRFAPRKITSEQLQQGVNQLYSQGLLQSVASGQGSELLERDRRQRSADRWQSWLKLLSFRLGSIDATRLVDGLHRRLRWIYSLPVLVCVMIVIARALSIAIGQADEVVARLPTLAELAQPRYWLVWLASVALVKIVHEFAHAVTCKHVGGRCHEIGVLLLAMIPCLYCDVSDVWRVPSKWRRIAVSSAGMIAELVIAAVAIIAWWHTQPGLLNVCCLSLVVVCTVGTLLVNANPLLRYDGYYILSDLVEVPNLSGRAQGLFPAALRRWLLAEQTTADPMLTERQRRGLVFYALAARVYLTLVLISIFALLLAWARPYRLENLVYTIGVITLAGILFAPVRAAWQMWRNPATRYRVRRPRLAAALTVVLAMVAAGLWWPVTYAVRGPAVLVARSSSPVYAVASGELTFALPAGTRVSRGDVIARLENYDAELALTRQQGAYEVSLLRQQQLSTMRTWNEHAAEQLPTAVAESRDALEQLGQLQGKVEELTLRAPRDGVLIAPPDVSRDQSAEGVLSNWTGTPLQTRNLGSWVEAGTLIAQVADHEKFEALVMIDQADVEDVRTGQIVQLRPESSPWHLLEGEVIQVGRRSTNRLSDDVAIDPGKYHLAQVRLTAHDAPVLVGTRASAKIESRRLTLSSIVQTELGRLLKLPW